MSMSAKKRSIIILIADDDAEDRMLLKEALEENRLKNSLQFVENGEELMDYLHHRGKFSAKEKYPAPGLILLDLNMPKKDGREALKEIKADPHLRLIPVVVLTTSKAEEDILKTYDLGVSSFITKPVTFTSLVGMMKTLSDYWFEIVELPVVK
jgi:CheY-like chemotaxis protein